MSTHTNINMSTAVSNFAADLNSEPFPFPNTDTSIKKSVPFVPLCEKWLLSIEEASIYFGVGQNRLANHYATIKKWLDEDSKGRRAKNYTYDDNEGECL